MKALLMYADRDFDTDGELPPNAQGAHRGPGAGHGLRCHVPRGRVPVSGWPGTAILSILRDVEAITYRQRILDDCQQHPGGRQGDV